jgi:hypothetical protein
MKENYPEMKEEPGWIPGIKNKQACLIVVPQRRLD